MTRRLVQVRIAGVLAVVLALSTGSALAVAVAGPAAAGGKFDPGRPTVPSTRPAPGAAQPSLDLLPARLEAVNLAARTVTIRGQRVPLHAERLRVFGAGGRLLDPAALRPGQAVRLALEPEAPVAAQAKPNANPNANANANANAKVSANARAAAGAKVTPPARRIVLIYIDG